MSHTNYCSFCRKPETAGARLVAGPGVSICDACVVHCARILVQCPQGSGGRLDLEHSCSTEILLGTLRGQDATLQEVRERLKLTISALRQREISWEKIGKALGCSRQAAWERFG